MAMAAMSILVDDDRDTCASMSDILSDLGYTVNTANGGPAAVSCAGERFCLRSLDARQGAFLFARSFAAGECKGCGDRVNCRLCEGVWKERLHGSVTTG